MRLEMDGNEMDGRFADLKKVLDWVVELTRPQQVYLYNSKLELDGSLRSFKLCVVCSVGDKRALLSRIFEVDCDTPFDVLLYTTEQFDVLRQSADSFASRIRTRGTLLYGQEL